MMKIKRKLSIVMAGMISLLLISGCGITKEGSQDVVDDKEKSVTEEVTVDDIKDVAEKVTVNRVIDGDTIEVTTKDGKTETVRLLLVDTPESVHPDKESELYGEDASHLTKVAVLDEQATVYLERGNPDKDKYGRTLGYVWVNSPLFGTKPVNLSVLLAEQGLARVAYVDGSNTKYLEDVRKAEQQAKDEFLNIWHLPGYVTDEGFDMSLIR